MELQSFIDTNTDYINKFKENDLYIHKYSLLNLILVKAKNGKNYDYENNQWIRYCRGVIINTETNRVVCIPPVKSVIEENIDINNYGDEWSFEPLVDGVMINMFYHNNEWMISTRSNIGAKNKWDGKVPFHELFKSVNGNEWFNNLNKEYSYSFTLQHRNNRIITPVFENMIFINEVYDLSNNNIVKLNHNDLPYIEGIENIISLDKKDVSLYLQTELSFSIKGFTIKNKSQRIKWINPSYKYVENLKVNNNNKFFSYLELRRTFNLSKYLEYFPEERYLFDNYRNKYNLIKNELYHSYISLKIKKDIKWENIRYEFKPHVRNLHNEHINNKVKINSQYINNYLDRLPIGKIYFIFNRIF